MKKMLFLITLFFLDYLSFSQTTSQNISRKIDDYINPFVKTKNFSGAVLISYKNSIIYKKAFGMMDEELNISNTLATKFNIASVSKLYTATAILLLQQKGLLTTNDYVSKFYPLLPYSDKITIHQLLIHTSGIPNINNLPGYDSLAVFPQTPESLINFIKEKTLDFEPGTKYRYSNTNYNLLALIIEKISGLSYGAFMEKYILSPLRLTNTGSHTKVTNIIPNIAKGYTSDGNFGLEKSQYLDWSSKTGNGSVYTTIEDLYKFRKVLDSNILLSKSSGEQMFTNHFENVGYGIFVSPHLNKKRQYINGRSPGVSSYMAKYPDDNLIIIVLSNNYIPLATQIGTDIAAIVFDMPYTKLAVSNVTSKDIAGSVVGKYKFTEKFFRPNAELKVSFLDGKLSCDWGELLFVRDYSFIIRSFWANIEFQKNENGEIVGLKYGNFVAKKME